MKKEVLLIMALSFWMAACNDSDYEGYDRLENSVHYQWISLGDETQPVKQADYVSFHMQVKNANNEVLAVKKFSRVRPDVKVFPAAFVHLLDITHQEDSIHVIGNVRDLHLSELMRPELFQSDTQVIRMSLSITEVLSELQWRELRARERMLNDLELKEQLTIKHLLDSLNLTEAEYMDGIYFRSIKEGKGDRPRRGDQVTVQYVGVFADGTPFENTYSGAPLEYEVGRPDQVLPGFASGIARMRVGGKAMFVIPSQFAFGAKGSSSGIVPPFATLIYQVELVEVRL